MVIIFGKSVLHAISFNVGWFNIGYVRVLKHLYNAIQNKGMESDNGSLLSKQYCLLVECRIYYNDVSWSLSLGLQNIVHIIRLMIVSFHLTSLIITDKTFIGMVS